VYFCAFFLLVWQCDSSLSCLSSVTCSNQKLSSNLGKCSYYHWRHVKIFWDTKVTEYVETMPYFVVNLWGKKLTKFSLFKDISWNQKIEKIFFFPIVFWARKLVETIQLFFHCCHHTSEENTAFEMLFDLVKLQKSRNLAIFLDVTNGL